MSAIILDKLNIHYGATPIIRDLSHTFTSGQWHIILGRSGEGKTTLLHAIAGLLPPSATQTGNIYTDSEQDIRQHIALMAQQNDILPWLNIIGNVTLADRLHHRRPDRQRALEILSACGIAELANVQPQTLSGGQRQRAALARTLMQDQPIVLMDEPFSALDAITRYQLQNLAATLLHGKTVLMITHDPSEALRLAHHLYILRNGSLQAIATPNSAPPRALNSDGIASAQETLIHTLSTASHD